MSYREANLQQPPLAATQSLKEEGCWVDLQQTLCLEFALYWLMWSCCRDLNCRRHAHPQCLFSWSSSPPEWVAPSSPGLHPDRYPEGMLALTQAQEPAPSSAAAVPGQKTPNLLVLVLSLADLMKMHFNTGRCLDV